jgi:hypothetical protein
LALKSVFNGKRDPARHPRTLVYGEILDFKTSAPIDKGLAVFMPAPWSFTGEDVVEAGRVPQSWTQAAVPQGRTVAGLRDLWAGAALPFTEAGFLVAALGAHDTMLVRVTLA